MKKKLIPIALAIFMLISLTPQTVAAGEIPTKIDGPVNAELTADYDPLAGNYFDFHIVFGVPESVMAFVWDSEVYGQISNTFINAELDYKYNDGDWHYKASWDPAGAQFEYPFKYGALVLEPADPKTEMYVPTNSFSPDLSLTGALDNDAVSVRVRFAVEYIDTDGVQIKLVSPWSGVMIAGASTFYSKASDWAVSELDKANANGLVPQSLKGADLTKPITRSEFAGVAVKLYESLSGKTASPAPSNTFTDTKDQDVLKAYALDIVNGLGEGKFSPASLLTRQEAAAMLTRVYKKLNWEGWTLAGDVSYTKHALDNTGVASFADDKQIDSWAKPSVYFMAKYEIIKGLGSGKFGPKNTTSAETAKNFANATREQALLISVRTFEAAPGIKDAGY